MYLKPGNLLQDISVIPKSGSLTSRGRVKGNYDKKSNIHFKGVFASASAKDVKRYNQKSHPITHTITQYNKPVAKEGDVFVFCGRFFYVHGVENPGEKNICTVYFVEERDDIHGQKPELERYRG